MDVSEKIKEIVNEANQLREDKNLELAKNRYLDAAQIALSHSRELDDKLEKLSYENVARALIDEARSTREEIFLNKLPSIPVDSKKQEIKDETDTLMIRKRPDVYSLWVIKPGGIPLISYEFKKMDTITEGKVNEILFSGAISAISNLMFEALERPIQTINFDKGVLIIQIYDEVNYVLFAEKDSPGLNKSLLRFHKELEEKLEQPINSPMLNMDMTDDDQVVQLVNKFFPSNQ